MEKTKEPKNPVVETAAETKPTYEQLEDYARQLVSQCKMLSKKLESKELEEACARLDFDLRILDSKTSFPVEFRNKIMEEVMAIMYPEPPQETKE